MSLIKAIHARSIFDGQGVPTVEVDVALAGGAFGRAAVPSGAIAKSGAAKGTLETATAAVVKSVEHVNGPVAAGLTEFDALDQTGADRRLREFSGDAAAYTIGCHASFAVSLAVARAAADFSAQPLYRYLGGVAADLLPIPLIDVLDSNRRDEPQVDFVRLAIVPVGFDRFRDALRCGCDVARWLSDDTEGRAGHVASNAASGTAALPKLHGSAFDLVLRAIRAAGYEPGEQVRVAVDLAADTRFDAATREYQIEGRQVDAGGMVAMLAEWVDKFPLWSITDGCSHDDPDGWKLLTARLGSRIQLIGDSILRNHAALRSGIEAEIANSVVIRWDRLATLTDAIATVHLSRQGGYQTLFRSGRGDPADAALADVAVALRSGQVAAGSAPRTEAMTKYNQLLRIEEELGPNAIFAGASAG